MEDLGRQTSNFIHIQNTETGIKNKISIIGSAAPPPTLYSFCTKGHPMTQFHH